MGMKGIGRKGEKTYDVVALGELLIDFAPIGTNASGYPEFSSNPGGAPSNLLSVNAAYGLKTGFIGQVGADAFGELLVDTLKEKGIDCEGIIKDPNTFTTLAFVTLDDEGDRSFSFARKPGADTQLVIDDEQLAQIENARCFHFGSLSMTNNPSKASTEIAIAKAEEAGVWINYDPNLRASLWEDLEVAKQLMLWGIGHANSLKISDEELEFLYGPDKNAGLARLFENENLKLVLLTLGKEGAICATPEGQKLIPAYAVPTVDTTGAGDIFGGTMLFQLLSHEGEDIENDALYEMTRRANATAALSTTKFGGITSIPSQEEVEEFLLDRE